MISLSQETNKPFYVTILPQSTFQCIRGRGGTCIYVFDLRMPHIFPLHVREEPLRVLMALPSQRVTLLAIMSQSSVPDSRPCSINSLSAGTDTSHPTAKIVSSRS